MTLVIAEIGVNHNGFPDVAEDLIDAAVESGADAVKFQLFDCEKLEPPGPRREMLRGLQLSLRDLSNLRDEAEKEGVEFICTPFDVDSLRFLVDDLKLKTIKISSGDLKNATLLKEVGLGTYDVLLSTGMANMTEVGAALNIVGPLNRTVTLLHCTSAYPTPLEDVNLRAMVAMRYFNVPVGLSDHSMSRVGPAAAVALGATVIEKHLTLDCYADGPDHHMSLLPQEFIDMVDNIREVEKCLGSGVKKAQPSEASVMEIVAEREAHR